MSLTTRVRKGDDELILVANVRVSLHVVVRQHLFSTAL